MAALQHAEEQRASIGRRRSWLLGTSPTSGTPEGVPDTVTLADELEDLRERLAAAERRAVEAEMALPHLLELGQRTVDGLLNDGRLRARQIIESARARAAAELEEQREAIRREARELDALRMAVAAEAMGLEQIRAELQRRISLSAVELGRMADDPRLLGGELPLDRAGLQPPPATALESPTARPVPPPDDLVLEEETTPDRGMGIIEASMQEAPSVELQVEISEAAGAHGIDEVDAARATEDGGAAAPVAAGEDVVVDVTVADDAQHAPVEARPAPGFASAWAEDEDDEVAEAFERFFSADVDYEPSRDWILADDTKS